ncbi:cyclin-dependent kinase B1-1-like isoform X2 [Cryptomeria japonica]|uniref:cyclin-dependent kinase B1-1-like isoform X2 n=1 Tax=Cryptomeria japonica TaxID=3369 RepID=UPI0027D9DF35|nr:cyclin-dependent kinase B1-1-like isoform X2 [Cryptomeria japonica]
MDDYEIFDTIGNGTYGKVYKAKVKNTGQIVAIKKAKLERDEDGIAATTLREISLLRMLSQNLNIVRLLDVKHLKCNDGRLFVCLIFEYVDCDLRDYIDKLSKTKMPQMLIKSFMYQLFKGVSYCHGHGVIHRDLKPQNILVDKTRGLLKLADFGLGRSFFLPVGALTHNVMTLWYRAPEVLLGVVQYSIPVDIWSLGCIFAEMSRMTPLFRGDSEIGQLLCIFRQLGTPTEDMWPGVSKSRNWHSYPEWKPQKLSLVVPDMEPSGVDLLSNMLDYDPAKRISAKEAMQHPYFDDLDKSQY